MKMALFGAIFFLHFPCTFARQSGTCCRRTVLPNSFAEFLRDIHLGAMP